MSDEDPPPPPRKRTPAERAGATPLDPTRFPPGPAPVAPVRRHRARPGNRNAARPPTRWLLVSAVLGLVGVLLVGTALATEQQVEVAADTSYDLVAATPVLSARRAPGLLARPVAARNLQAAIAPVMADAPPETCLQIRDGATPLANELADAPLVPASNMKIVVAAAALDLLGPDTRLATRFVTDGAPTDGTVVKGNLYMIGGGDPLLSTGTYLAQLPNGRPPSTDMALVADQIVATGIREITGSVVGDESRYDTQRTVADWPERYLTQGQVGPLSALTVDDSWRVGVGVAPEPALHAATVLTDLLEDRGVEVVGEPRVGAAPAEAPVLTEVSSPTVAELVTEALQFSDNTTTELLVKEIGLQASGEGTSAAGLDAVRSWITDSGLPAEGIVIVDGSGLSEANRLSCALLGSVLVEEGPTGTVADGLAQPGEPGTLQDRLSAERLQGRVRAKTGTLRPVTALSGWLRTDPEADLTFSFVINTPDRQIRESDLELQGRLLESMLAYPQSPPLDDLGPGQPVPPAS